MMDDTPDLHAILADAERGQKLKATIQLGSLIAKNPDNLALRDELAQLYFDAGFLDAAGKFWLLNGADDQKIRECVAIYEKSKKFSGSQILQDIKFKGDKFLLSEYARNKLTQLETDSLKKTNSIPVYTYREKEKAVIIPTQSNRTLAKLGCAVGVVIVLFCVYIFIVGFRAIFG